MRKPRVKRVLYPIVEDVGGVRLVGVGEVWLVTCPHCTTAEPWICHWECAISSANDHATGVCRGIEEVFAHVH